VVICLERGADFYMAQLMPLPLTVSCFSKIQIGFTFLVPAHSGSPGNRAIKWVLCVYIQFLQARCHRPSCQRYDVCADEICVHLLSDFTQLFLDHTFGFGGSV